MTNGASRARVTHSIVTLLVTSLVSGCSFTRKYFSEPALIRAASKAFDEQQNDGHVPIDALSSTGKRVKVLLRRDVTTRALGETSELAIDAVEENAEPFQVLIVPSRTKSRLGTALLISASVLAALGTAAGVSLAYTTDGELTTASKGLWGAFAGTLAVTVGLGIAFGVSSGIDDDELSR